MEIIIGYMALASAVFIGLWVAHVKGLEDGIFPWLLVFIMSTCSYGFLVGIGVYAVLASVWGILSSFL